MMVELTEKMENQKSEEPNLKGDILNIIMLIYLYTLQSIPRTISNAIPLILQSRKATYTDQAAFSFVSYAYCFRLLWAPLVDCAYWKKLGRRKTWVIPTMYLIAFFMFLMSMNVNEWIGTENGSEKPNVQSLAIVLSICILLSSTQDIAVDGWSMTILQKRNRGYAGMCNGIGYSISTLFGFVLVIVLDSKDFCNRFRAVPQDHGFVSFADFTLLWSVVMAVSTTLLLIFKKEESPKEKSPHDSTDDSECKLSLKESYIQLWEILRLPAVQKFCFFLLTNNMCFGVLDGVLRLKFIDVGIPRDNYALLAVPSIPFALVLPFLLGRYTAGKKSMRTYFAFYVFRLVIMGNAYAMFVFLASFAKEEDGTLATWYYCLLLLAQNIGSVVVRLMSTIMGAFFNQVSDPRFGGMYITLFSTAENIGSRWAASLCLWLVDILTIKTCDDGPNASETCKVILDGFYVETMSCTVIGLFWFCWAWRLIRQLEAMDPSSWIVSVKSSISKDMELCIAETQCC